MHQVMHLSVLLMNNQAKLYWITDVVLGMTTVSPSPAQGITKLESSFPECLTCLTTVRLFAQGGRHILFMSFAHSKDNNLVLPLVLLKLENDAWRFWRCWAPNLHRDLEYMQVDFKLGGGVFCVWFFFLEHFEKAFFLSRNINALINLIFYYSCSEFTGVVTRLEPISEWTPHLTLYL